jgi:hypothetical protein
MKVSELNICIFEGIIVCFAQILLIRGRWNLMDNRENIVIFAIIRNKSRYVHIELAGKDRVETQEWHGAFRCDGHGDSAGLAEKL